MSKYFILLSFFCFWGQTTIAQNTTRPTVPVPNGFEVNSYTGNLYQSRTDMRIPGQGLNIDITFSYNVSRRAKNWGMGKGWTFTYNMAYATDQSGVWIERPDGKRDLFQKSGNVYLSPQGVYDELIEYQTGKFYLKTKDDLKYYFDNSSNKRLTKMEDINGNVINIAYSDTLISTLTDGVGHSLAFSWTNGKLIEITDNSCSPTRKVSYAYDAKGSPIKVTNPVGDFIKYYYDPTQKIIGHTDEAGSNTAISYNANSAVSKITSCITTHLFSYVPQQGKTYVTEKVNGQSVVTIYSFDSQGRVSTKKGNCCGYNVDYIYDSQNNISSRKDGNKKETKYEYDSKGNVTKETDPAGNFNTYTYTAQNNVASMTDKNGYTTTYQYDAKGNTTQINKPLGVTEKYTYDAKGNKLSYTDGNNNVTLMEYDTKGNLTKITDAEGGITTYTFDCYNNRLTETNPRGFTTTYLYNGLNQLVRVTDALNNSTNYTYTKLGQIASITNALGKVTSYIYDGLGRRISTILPLGNTTQTEYDEQGNIIKETDANGNSTTYTYNNRKQPLSITDALGNTINYEYDDAGNKLSETDKNGNKTSFEYDDQYHLVKRIDALGGITQYNYDAVGNRIAEINALGNATTYEYDALRRTKKVTDALGNSVQYTYDANGNQLTQKDKNGNVTTNTYDKLNRVKTITNALNGVITYTYDANGNLLTEKDPLNNTTTNTYDNRDRKLTVKNALNEVTAYTYDAVGNEKTMSMPNGNTIVKVYNDNNKLTSISDDLGMLYTYTYDLNQNVITEKDGNNNAKTNEYDVINRKIKVIDALGNSVLIQYDANNNLIKMTDRNGNPKTYSYDGLNRKLTEKDALNNVTKFTYDAVGNQLSITDAKGNITSYNYDNNNELVKEIYANGTYQSFTYDPNGNRKSRRDAAGNITNFFYDALGRIIKRSYPNGSEDVFSYDAAGRRLTANNANATVTFTYDVVNKMLSETLNGKTTAYAYNTTSRTRTITYPSNRIIVEERGKREQLLNIKEGANNISSFTYDAGNRLTAKSFANGYSVNYTYNSNNWLTSLTCMPNNVLGFSYTYDKVGNKLTVTKSHRSTHSEKYIYDNINQLVGFHTGRLTNNTLTDTTYKSLYTYDALHNRINSLEGGILKSYTSNNLNQITTVQQNLQTLNFQYDVEGNLINDGTLTYNYDFENRQISINNGAVQNFYDALGRRIKTIVNGSEILYFFSKNKVIEERSSSNLILKTNIYGIWIDDLISFNTGNIDFYVANNHQGTSLAIFNNNGIVENYEYFGFGEFKAFDKDFIPKSNSSYNGIFYTGRPFLEYQKKYDFRTRNYDSEYGSFMQKDPYRYIDGYNLYSAYFSPNGIDPYGLQNENTNSCFHFGIAKSKNFNLKFFKLDVDVEGDVKYCLQELCCNEKKKKGYSNLEASIGFSTSIKDLFIIGRDFDFDVISGWYGVKISGSIGGSLSVSNGEAKCDDPDYEICSTITGSFSASGGVSATIHMGSIELTEELSINGGINGEFKMCWPNIKAAINRQVPNIKKSEVSGEIGFKVDAWFIDFEYTIWSSN